MRTVTSFTLLFALILGTRGDDCDQVHSGDTGQIFSPGWPNDYPSNAVCNIRISVTSGNIIIYLKSFDVEDSTDCEYDSLKVYDGSDDSATLLGTFCGHYHRDSIVTTGSEALLVFVSDESVDDKGFDITYGTTGGNPDCDQVHSEDTGRIFSPGWPDKYPHDVVCNIRISVAPEKRLNIFFNSFMLQNGGDCNSDSLKVYDGSDTSATLLGTFCGHERPDPIVTSGGEALLVFKTDSTVDDDGFDITYSTTDFSVCTVQGDAHYVTFDGLHGTSQGVCTYEMVISQSCNVHMETIAIRRRSYMDKLKVIIGGSEYVLGRNSITMGTNEYDTNGFTGSQENEDVDIASVDEHLICLRPKRLDIYFKACIHRTIRRAKIYVSKGADGLKGVCGNNNMNPGDDYKNKNDIDESPNRAGFIAMLRSFAAESCENP